MKKLGKNNMSMMNLHRKNNISPDNNSLENAKINGKPSLKPNKSYDDYHK